MYIMAHCVPLALNMFIMGRNFIKEHMVKYTCTTNTADRQDPQERTNSFVKHVLLVNIALCNLYTTWGLASGLHNLFRALQKSQPNIITCTLLKT